MQLLTKSFEDNSNVTEDARNMEVLIGTLGSILKAR